MEPKISYNGYFIEFDMPPKEIPMKLTEDGSIGEVFILSKSSPGFFATVIGVYSLHKKAIDAIHKDLKDWKPGDALLVINDFYAYHQRPRGIYQMRIADYTISKHEVL